MYLICWQIAKHKMKQKILQYRNHCVRRVVGINGGNIKNVQKELKNTQKLKKKSLKTTIYVPKL